AQSLARSSDVRFNRVAIGALQAWRDQRRAVDSIVDPDLIVGLVDVGAGAQTRAAEDLLAALLSLRAQRCIGAWQQGAIRATHSGAGVDAVVLNLLKLRIVAPRKLDRLVYCQRGLTGRIAWSNLGGCLHGACHKTYEEQ